MGGSDYDFEREAENYNQAMRIINGTYDYFIGVKSSHVKVRDSKSSKERKTYRKDYYGY